MKNRFWKAHLAKILSSAFALLVMAVALVMSGVMPNTAFAVSDEDAATYLRSNPGAVVTVNRIGATANLVQTMAVSTPHTITFNHADGKEMETSIAPLGTTTNHRIALTSASNGWTMTKAGDAGTHISGKILVESTNQNMPGLDFNDVGIQPYYTEHIGNTWILYIDFTVTENMVTARR